MERSMGEASLTIYEERLRAEGITLVAGVDEVGRGCLAGPVFAAAVILPFPCDILGIKDSKKLSPRVRERLFDQIAAKAVSVGLGVVEPDVIDRENILNATKRAMLLAIAELSPRPEYLLIDGNQRLATTIPQLAIPQGDNKSISVAAASIYAKVSRDRLMVDYESSYPGFSFAAHKGYGTASHIEELGRLGFTPIHRRSFVLRGRKTSP